MHPNEPELKVELAKAAKDLYLRVHRDFRSVSHLMPEGRTYGWWDTPPVYVPGERSLPGQKISNLYYTCDMSPYEISEGWDYLVNHKKVHSSKPSEQVARLFDDSLPHLSFAPKSKPIWMLVQWLFMAARASDTPVFFDERQMYLEVAGKTLGFVTKQAGPRFPVVTVLQTASRAYRVSDIVPYDILMTSLGRKIKGLALTAELHNMLLSAYPAMAHDLNAVFRTAVHLGHEFEKILTAGYKVIQPLNSREKEQYKHQAVESARASKLLHMQTTIGNI